jgi:hypothetical protein
MAWTDTAIRESQRPLQLVVAGGLKMSVSETRCSSHDWSRVLGMIRLLGSNCAIVLVVFLVFLVLLLCLHVDDFPGT